MIRPGSRGVWLERPHSIFWALNFWSSPLTGSFLPSQLKCKDGRGAVRSSGSLNRSIETIQMGSYSNPRSGVGSADRNWKNHWFEWFDPDQGKLTSLATHSAATPASLHLISACSLMCRCACAAPPYGAWRPRCSSSRSRLAGACPPPCQWGRRGPGCRLLTCDATS